MALLNEHYRDPYSSSSPHSPPVSLSHILIVSFYLVDNHDFSFFDPKLHACGGLGRNEHLPYRLRVLPFSHHNRHEETGLARVRRQSQHYHTSYVALILSLGRTDLSGNFVVSCVGFGPYHRNLQGRGDFEFESMPLVRSFSPLYCCIEVILFLRGPVSCAVELVNVLSIWRGRKLGGLDRYFTFFCHKFAHSNVPGPNDHFPFHLPVSPFAFPHGHPEGGVARAFG
ncbi:hypothetical protein F5880DRAFT_1570629 [Lentinula raphanica]|nr:hypothetical protein F5880DRAFT_1570629 [Lentinula raphanica]